MRAITGLATTSKEVSSTEFEDVEQIFHHVTKNEKIRVLSQLVRESGNKNKRILVFMKTNNNAGFVATMLFLQRIPHIRADRVRPDIKRMMEDFNNGNPNILVAISPAICGPNMTNVDIVVNYDLPETLEEYVYKLGLTGGDGHRGMAVSFFDADEDVDFTASLAKTLRLAYQPSPDILRDRATLARAKSKLRRRLQRQSNCNNDFNAASAAVSRVLELDQRRTPAAADYATRTYDPLGLHLQRIFKLVVPTLVIVLSIHFTVMFLKS